jgi:4-amino-4-deoxy-L-arabinose transferase-like glycosyltransferase
MRSLRPSAFLLLLVLLALFACFFELGRMDVIWANEGQRAAPPAEMLRTGDWVMPTLNERPYLAKPPLLYWVIAALYSATGSTSEWIARMPTALCMVGLVLSVYLFGRRVLGETAGRWAALITLSGPYFLERARWANLDLPLTFTTFLCLIALYTAWQSDTAGRRYSFAVLAGLALAAATLLKGPVPYLFLLASLFGYLLMQVPDAAPERRQGLWWSAGCLLLGLALYPLAISFPVALVLLIAGWCVIFWRGLRTGLFPPLAPALVALVIGIGLSAPWAFAVLQRMGWEHISLLLGSEVVDRTHTATDINSGTPLYFFIGLLAMVAPFSLLLPLQLGKPIWRAETPAYRWCVTAGWLSVLIFSLIAGKEYEYILPGVPLLLLALGAILARATENTLEGTPATVLKFWEAGFRSFLTLGAVGLVGYTLYTDGVGVLFIEMIFIALLALVVLWTPLNRETLPVAARVAVATTLVVVGGLVYRSFHYEGVGSPRDIARLCGDLVQAGHRVEATRIYPQFTYYAAHPIPEVLDTEAIVADLQGDAPYFYLTREQFVQGFHGEDVPGTTIVMGPVTDKELILVTNDAGLKVLEAMSG